MYSSEHLSKLLEKDSVYRYWNYQAAEARSLVAHPQISALIAQADAARVAGDAYQIDALIDEFLDTDLASVENIILRWISDQSSDFGVLPVVREVIESNETPFSAIRLTDTPNITISLQSISNVELEKHKKQVVQRSVQFSGQVAHYKILRGGRSGIRLWYCTPFSDASDFRELTCWIGEEREVSIGDTFTVDGSRESISFVQCDSPVAFIQVINKSRDVGVSVDFDDKSGAYKASQPTDRAATRRMIMASALRHLQFSDCTDILTSLLERGPFYQRWHVARELIARDPLEGLDIAGRLAADDPNPSVRRAATATYELLKQRSLQE